MLNLLATLGFIVIFTIISYLLLKKLSQKSNRDDSDQEEAENNQEENQVDIMHNTEVSRNATSTSNRRPQEIPNIDRKT